MSHGLTRLQSRFQADPSDIETAQAKIGEALDAEAAEQLGLVTFALDDMTGRTRSGFCRGAHQLLARQPYGMEANLRFVGPETIEVENLLAADGLAELGSSSAPNAVGEEGALRRYGHGQKAQFDMTRV